jgi:hypothetical protein
MKIEPVVLLVKSLAETLFIAKKNYYNGFTSISDEQYDALEEALKKLCPSHPLIAHAVGDVGWDWLIGIEATSFLVQNKGFTIPHNLDPLDKSAPIKYLISVVEKNRQDSATKED